MPAIAHPRPALGPVPLLRPWLRPIAWFVITAHLALVLQPLSAIAQSAGQQAPNPVAQAQLKRYQALSQQISQAQANRQRAALTPAELLPEHLQNAQQLSQHLRAKAHGASVKDHALQASWSQLQSTLKSIQSGNGQTLAEITATGQQLRQQGADAVILERQAQAERQLQERIAQFERIAAPLLAAASPKPEGADQAGIAHPLRRIDRGITGADVQALTPALAELEHFLAQNTPAKSHSPLDPKQLPWGAAKATPRAPAETAAQWEQKLKAQPASQATPQSRADKAAPKSKAPTSAQTSARASTIAGLQFTHPPAPDQAPTAADLGETDEIQLSPAIRAKAQELGHNPVAIHNWVRNTIDWQPTWGALQSADSVLASQRGNAHDIASLTIALLRASKIPARYQWGTIELPAQTLMNWAGGLSQPEAALNLLGQGGIAARGVVSGGRITHVRMEHVWVSAYVNYAPSRGALAGDTASGQHVNPNAALNAWVPIDGAYKTYSYAPGLDLQAQVPLDANAILQAARQGAVVNEEQGWVQNLNQAAIQNQLSAYQNRLKAHIDSQHPNATVGDVIGKKIIPERLPPMLAGKLATAVIALGPQATRIPAGQQHRFIFKLYSSQQARNWDEPILSLNELTSRLSGKRISLSYLPATQADADLIASYLPQPNADGSPIRPEQLPSSLPGYLIRLKPQISIDGQVVAQSPDSLSMGTPLYSAGGFTRFGSFTPELLPSDSHAAGNATAIGVSAGGITAQQMEQLKARLQQTHSQLQQAQANPGSAANALSGLTGERISGDMLTAPLWSWLAASESHARLSQGQAGVVEVTGNSYGLLHAVAEPIYSWGVIRQVKFPGMNIDMPYQRLLTVARNNDNNSWVAYNRLRGQYGSGLEHAVLERYFNDPSQCNSYDNPQPQPGLPACPQGISSVKALSLAAEQGQKIYTITAEVYQRNPHIVSQQLSAHSPQTRSRIQNALDQGLEVSVHEKPISQDGWSGAGYILIDPLTGAGAYEIEGMTQGGGFLASAFVYGILSVIALLLGPVGVGFAVFFLIMTLLSAILFSFYGSIDLDVTAFIDYGWLTLSALGITIAVGSNLAVLGLAIMALLYSATSVVRDFLVLYG